MSRRLLAGTEVEEDDMMLEVVVVFGQGLPPVDVYEL